MIESANSQWLFHKSMQNFTRYSLTALLSVVVLSDAVEAAKNTELHIVPQEKLISQEAIRVAAKRAYVDSFSENIAREVFTGSIHFWKKHLIRQQVNH
ncbi:hypothetical protein FD724_21640 [Nostoc sp. C057]|uniref:hypothetical protein n=1 Tax=Nostoc sp. C057 TaxID=2576903 RepID=UPI0015C3A912|nr:hypothetical protein [Nostoc sp. C057]QLE50441.1 hypothetical protein FD724_21640 [Nostoc sp. C057]